MKKPHCQREWPRFRGVTLGVDSEVTPKAKG